MLFTYDLQMFADEIPGIDADVLEQFKDELPQEEPEQQPTEEETAPADTHSDNKEVEEQQPTEEDEPEKGSSIPYDRFKSVNDRMKTSEARVKELEAELANMRSGTAPQQPQQAPPAPEAQQQAADDFNAQQIQLMTAEARKRAAVQLQLTDEDIENMEYQDDPNVKASYDALTAQYMGEVRKEVIEYRNQQFAYMNDIKTTNANYQNEVAAFKADPEYKQKWDAVCKAAVARGESFLTAAQGAIDRLDAGRGTSGDFYFVKMFMDSVLADYKPAAPAAPAVKQNKKITEAAKLPTAPSVGGSTKGDIVWDVATITDYVNRGKMDEIPKDVLTQVMGQSIAPGDQEE